MSTEYFYSNYFRMNFKSTKTVVIVKTNIIKCFTLIRLNKITEMSRIITDCKTIRFEKSRTPYLICTIKPSRDNIIRICDFTSNVD